MIPDKIPGYVFLCIFPVACLPDGGGLGGRALPAPDADPQSDAGADQGIDLGSDRRGAEPRPELPPDAEVDAPWDRSKQAGAACAADEECFAGYCGAGKCSLRPNGVECGDGWQCVSTFCNGKVCADAPCPIEKCQVRPSEGAACVSTCGAGLLCCPGGCRTPVDGGIKPDAGDQCF